MRLLSGRRGEWSINFPLETASSWALALFAGSAGSKQMVPGRCIPLVQPRSSSPLFPAMVMTKGHLCRDHSSRSTLGVADGYWKDAPSCGLHLLVQMVQKP